MIELPNGNVIIFGEHMDDYRRQSQHSLTSHQLGKFRECPELYHKIKTGVIKPNWDKREFKVGAGAHTLLLEGPEVYEQEYAWNPPLNPNTQKAYGPTSQKFLNWDERQPQTGLMPDENNLIHDLVHSVQRHSKAKNLLVDGKAELVVRGKILGIPAQCRIDYLIREQETTIVDFKTCSELNKFPKQIYNFCYADQLAFYSLMLDEPSCPSVYLIACEKQEPYRTGVWRVKDTMLTDRRERVSELILDLKDCTETNKWPTGYEEIREY